jgi:hypothetical protein
LILSDKTIQNRISQFSELLYNLHEKGTYENGQGRIISLWLWEKKKNASTGKEVTERLNY